MMRRIAEFPLVPNTYPANLVLMMLRSTWNVWASIGLGPRRLDYDNALVTHDEPRVGGAVILNKRVGVLRDFDYSRFVGCGCQGLLLQGFGYQVFRCHGWSSDHHHTEFANEESGRQQQTLFHARPDASSHSA